MVLFASSLIGPTCCSALRRLTALPSALEPSQGGKPVALSRKTPIFAKENSFRRSTMSRGALVRM